MMNNKESLASPKPDQESVAMLGQVATWRYFGERAEADLAYRVRFGGAEPPEPIAFRGTLAYTLPVEP
jgi:hypothetical protein